MNRKEYVILCLGEEASEVIKEASKINRFGENDKNPSSIKTHKENLVDEFHDFLAVYQMALDEIGLEFEIDDKKIRRKKEKMENMIILSKKMGKIQ